MAYFKLRESQPRYYESIVGFIKLLLASSRDAALAEAEKLIDIEIAKNVDDHDQTTDERFSVDWGLSKAKEILSALRESK